MLLDTTLTNAYIMYVEAVRRVHEQPLSHEDFQLVVGYALMGLTLVVVKESELQMPPSKVYRDTHERLATASALMLHIGGHKASLCCVQSVGILGVWSLQRSSIVL